MNDPNELTALLDEVCVDYADDDGDATCVSDEALDDYLFGGEIAE
jgi:hypothetical protein